MNLTILTPSGDRIPIEVPGDREIGSLASRIAGQLGVGDGSEASWELVTDNGTTLAPDDLLERSGVEDDAVLSLRPSAPDQGAQTEPEAPLEVAALVPEFDTGLEQDLPTEESDERSEDPTALFTAPVQDWRTAPPPAYGSVPPSASPASGSYAAPPTAPVRKRRKWPFVVIPLLVVLAAGGAAAAVVLMKDDDGGARVSNGGSIEADVPNDDEPLGTDAPNVGLDDTDSSTEADDGATGSLGPSSSDPDVGALDVTDQSVMADDILAVITQHYDDIVAGDYQAAWDLLSTRKQNKYRAETGFDGWQRNQETVTPYLDTSDGSVTVREYDPATHVATIRVSGWGWSGAKCSAWEGVTWVRAEAGEWRYDPGYSTTPQRAALWKPRYTQLLGVGC
ncbi:MAG: hypothetical protein J7513_05930 [Solirubrobacteraceae bacterium]|nr:hypothetical protein [Solirubrobacteraceae bacterium]